MIDVMVTVSVNEELLTMFGTVDEEGKTIALNYQIMSKTIDDLDLLHHRKMDIPLVDTGVNSYCAYGCKFLTKSISISTGTVHLEGVFDRLIRERKVGCEYDSVMFGFVGIEEIFPLEKFSTQIEDETHLLELTKEKRISHQHTLLGTISCAIESDFEGAISSTHLYNLQLTQKKMIKIRFPEKKSVDSLLQFVDRIKKYFEFLLRQEVKLEKIVFYDSPYPGVESATLLADPILEPKTFIKKVGKKPYRGSTEELFVGLNGWLAEYEKYKEVVEIWQKTVYNTNVSEDDLFIWRCQAFELLCTVNNEIFTKANTFKAKNQANPNLKNFLAALKNLYGIMNVDAGYFKDVKDVRDKLTHNNPTKTITERQKKNSREIVQYALTKTFSQIIGITGMPFGYCLIPPGEE